ncbi:hypothetical protein PLESTB_000530600 [Pleodorina starrii]|uniref:Ku domain-containing protein n=1 Tax=Pleodorina starrii TaxID=330485 RepID=A0A9W6BGC0_9CHLO|nr:hypothetical protein PLESTM_000394100 [Pleodorina starrii]GLC51701.1 hypothetical protein PLESTB_000530600 [Pleodorina starrii]
MANKKDVLVLVLDVGDHMQPYLPLMHRMVFNVLNCKLLSKPNHEVAVVLYGTKSTRHKLYDPDDPVSYHHVTVLRPLQNVSDYLELERFAFASDPRVGGAAAAAAGYAEAAIEAEPEADDPSAQPAPAAAAAALLARVEAAGLACGDAAAACGRAARLFGPPGPKADWADGLVVALDLVASALEERFNPTVDRREAAKLGVVRVVLVSNLLGQSEPFEDDFRATLVDTCTHKRILIEVASLDHYVPPPPPPAASPPSPSLSSAAADGSGVDMDLGGGGGREEPGEAAVRVAGRGGGGEALAALPAELAASRRRNLEQLHLLKSEMAPAPFRHLRQPAELLCLFRAKEVAYQASNAVFMLTPPPLDEEDSSVLPAPLSINVKLYKKIRRTRVDEWKTVVQRRASAGEAGGDAADVGAGGDDEGGGGGGGGGGRDPGFIREVEYEDPTTGQKFTRDDFVVKGYSYGKQAVPIAQYADMHGHVVDEQMRKFKEKDFSLLGFVDAASVPHHRLIDEPHVVLGDSPSSAVVIASLALVLQERGQAGVVRFLIRKESPQLGLLTPHLSDSPDVPHALLLSPLPFAEDIRTHAFSTFRNEQEAREMPRRLAEARGEAPPPEPEPEPAAAPLRLAPPSEGGIGIGPSQLGGVLGRAPVSEPGLRYEKLQPDDEQQDAALALVRALDLGPSPLLGSGTCRASPYPPVSSEPHPEALAPEGTANPALQRAYSLVTSRALDPTAQLPDPEDDPLVELVLQPHGRYWPAGAREAIQRAEGALQTREHRRDGEGGPAAKRARREADDNARQEDAGGGAAAGDAGTAGTGREAVVFDPSAAGGTAAARVRRVGELTAVEDFRAMVAQGRDSASDAVQQLQELVRVLVGRSIGDQLYDKAVKCVLALREGCAATGRAGAFNRFLTDLAAWCKSQDRGGFVSALVQQQISLITHQDLNTHRQATGGGGGAQQVFEDDGCAVAAWEAHQFLERHARTEEAEVEATLPAVVADEEFEDMD